jgi:hypothetical protein
MVKRLAPGLTPAELQHIERYERETAEARHAQVAAAAFLQVVSLPAMLASEYFTSPLSAGVREALYEIGQAVRLEHPQSEVFHYLIRNVKWMPAFAKLVSEVILLHRKKSWVSASGVMIKQAKEELYFAILDFQHFRMWDGSEMYRELSVGPVPTTRRVLVPKRRPIPSDEPTLAEEEEEEAEESVVRLPRAMSFQPPSRESSPGGRTTTSDLEYRLPPRLYRQNLEEKYSEINV